MQSENGHLQPFTEEQADDSTHIIQVLKYVQDDVGEVRENVERMEDQMMAMYQMVEHMCRLMISTDKHRKQKVNQSEPKVTPRKGSTEKEIAEYNNLTDALQENILLFLSDLPFCESLLPEQLITKECISEEDCAYIRSLSNRTDKIRTLIRMIKRRDRKTILNFLDIVGDDNPYLKNKVHESFNHKQNLENKSDRPTCTTCMMVKIVDLKDIIDTLWKEKLISDDLYDVVIADAERHRDIIWNSIFHSLNKKSNSEQCISVLVNALENKYGHIADILKEETDLNKLQCCCLRRSNQYRKRLPNMSSSTQSSLTNVSVSRVPRTIDLLQQTSLNESCEDSEPKLEKLAEKYDISKYIIKTGDGQKIPKVVPNVDTLSCNPTTNKDQTTSVVSTNDKEIQTLSRIRHESGNLSPSEESNYISQNQDSKNFNRTVSTSLVPEAGFMLSEYQNMSAVNNNIENTTMLVEENQSNPLAPNIIKTGEKVKRDTPSLPSYSDNSKACEKTCIENRSSRKNKTKPNARRNLYQNQKKCVPTGLLVTKTHIFHSRQSKRSFKRIDNHNQKNLEKKIAQRNLHYNHLWNITNQKRKSILVNDESEKQISFDNDFTELQKTDKKFDWCTESDDSESPGPSM